MTKILCIILASTLALAPALTIALDESGKYYLTLMTQGGPQSIRRAAQGVVQSGEKSTEVLDVLAEILLQNARQPGNTYIDAMAWVTKALGGSGNPRYRSALLEVSKDKAVHKKTRKYAKKAMKQVGKAEAEQYVKGTIDLAAKRAEYAAAEETEVAASGDYKPITSAVIGMNQNEVITLCGPPTTTTSHMTGKAFKPFNFRGNDTLRTILIYKGQGRIVLSNTSSYSNSYTVLEVVVNASESGYP